jgi:DNA-directed RNA polymerase sigma subunit (sigma70/sigma32)
MAPRPPGRGRAPGSRIRPPRIAGTSKAAATSNHNSPQQAPETGLRSLFEEASLAGHPSAEERARLLERAGAGDEAARDILLKTKMEMVGRMAAARTERGLPFGDLVQEGSIGLMGAIDYFHRSGRADFDAFAEEQVAAQMEAALESEAAAVREANLVVEAAQQYEDAEMALARDLGRAPTEAELSKKLNWTAQRTSQIGEIVDEARRLHDEELLEYIDPDALDGEFSGPEEDAHV